jgi:peroxiredoxin
VSYALLTARLLLSAVFAVAGSAKLADRAGSRQALIDFGVPTLLAGPLGILLPVAELAVSVILLPIASAWLGGIGALSLLFAFLLGIAINLVRGRTPNCHCFGQLHSAPAGWSTLVRDAALACVAAFVVWQGRYNAGPSVVGWFSDLTTAQRVALLGGLAGLALLTTEVALLLQILRQQGRILMQLEAVEARFTSGVAPPQSLAVPSAGLPIGTRAPSFRLPGFRGETITLEALVAAGKPVLLLFTNPHCGPCQALLPDIGRWQREHSTALNIALVSEGTAKDNRAKSSAHGVRQVLLQRKREVAEGYKAWGTPAAVLIRPDGTIASGLAQGADSIRALVAQSLATPSAPILDASPERPATGRNGNGRGRKLGDRAPALELPDVRGKSVALSEFRGREVVLLFWNPNCGYCQRMLDDLRDLDADPPPAAPLLVVVSTGSVEDTHAMNLRSPVLHDHAAQASAAFGANGTPMAVLLDAKGRIASEIVAGAQAVLALAGANDKR